MLFRKYTMVLAFLHSFLLRFYQINIRLLQFYLIHLYTKILLINLLDIYEVGKYQFYRIYQRIVLNVQ